MAKNKPDKTNIRYNYHGRFLTRYLYVETDLLGAIHEFDFEEYIIKIELPGIQDYSKKFFNEEEDRICRRVSCQSWVKKKPAEYIIHNIDLRVFGNEEKLLPAEILTRNPNCFDLFTNAEQKELFSILNKYNEIAEQAFDYWVRHIRWKFDNGSIARPLLHGHESGWGPALESTQKVKPIWYAATVISIQARQKVTREQWNYAQKSLRLAIDPPLYYDYFFDGEENLSNGDYRRALIDFCIAVESALRELLERKIPDELHSELKKFLTRVNIAELKGSKFQKALFDNSTLENFKKDKVFKHLTDMFENRNKLMHSGKLNDNVTRDLKNQKGNTKTFIDSIDSLLNKDIKEVT